MLYVEGTYQSLPPGNEAGQQTGWLQLDLSNVVLVKGSNENVGFRVCMWGSREHQLFLPSTDQSGSISTRYEVRASRAVLMKYLNDMATLVVEAYDPRNKKKLGNIFVSLKRFQTVGESGQPTISNFREKFDIVTSGKQKLGEVTLGFQTTEVATPVNPRPTVHPIRDEPAIIEFEKDPRKPSPSRPKYPPVTIEEQVQVDDPTKYLPHRPCQEPTHNRQTKKRNTHQQTSELFPAVYPAEHDFVSCNFSVEMMKLKEDEAMLLTDHSAMTENINLANAREPLELSVEFINVKFNYKLGRPVEKLVVVYPQLSKAGEMQPVTTMLTAVKATTNSSEFNQSILFRLPDKTHYGSAHPTIEVICGDGSAICPTDKLLEAQPVRLALKKKDGSKYGELLCRVASKAVPAQFTAVLYIGNYKFDAPGSYSICINCKKYDTRKVIPASPNDFRYRMVNPSSSNPTVMVLEVWRKTAEGESIYGIVKLNIMMGSCDQRIGVRAITGETIGWIRIISGLVADPTELNREIDKRMSEQQSNDEEKDPHRGQLPNPAPEPHPIPAPLEPKQNRQELHFPEIYLRVMQSIRASKDRRCKNKTDLFLEQQSITMESLLELLKLTNSTLSDRQLNFFARHFDYPLEFQQFFGGYLKYCSYERKIRLNLQELVHMLLKQTSFAVVKNCMRKATLYYGYVEKAEFVELLREAGVEKVLAAEIAKYLMHDSKGQVFLDEFYEIVEGKRSVNHYTFSHFVRHELLKTHTAEELQVSVRKFREDSSHNLWLTHLENSLLGGIEDDQQLHEFVPPERLHHNPSPIEPARQEDPIIVEPKPPKKLDDGESEPDRVRKVQVLIGSVDCTVGTVTELIVNREICLLNEELPQVVLLPEDEPITVTIHTREGFVLEGEFIAQEPNTPKIRLFCRAKEAGWLHFTQAKPSEVRIDITKKTSREEMPHREPYPLADEAEPELRYLNDERINLQIVSLVPSGNYQFTISGHKLNYPVENSLILRNTKDEMLPVNLFAPHDIQGQTEIRLPEGTTKYAVNRSNGSVMCIVEVRVSRTIGQPKPMAIGRKNLFLFIDRLDCPLLEAAAPQDKYYLLIESEQVFTKTNEFSFGGRRSCYIRTSVQLKECREYRIQLINSKRQATVEFHWSTDLSAELGIHRKDGYLRSGAYRLSLILFEVNYNDDFSLLKKGPQKMQQLLKVFSGEALLQLDKQLQNGKPFGQVMRDSFRFTHSEINVLEGLIGTKLLPASLFSLRPRPNSKQIAKAKHSLGELCNQFFLYDFDSIGFLKIEKAKLVLSLLYQPDEIEVDLDKFVPANQRSSEWLVDLNNLNNDQVDYFELLRHLQISDPSDQFFSSGAEDKENTQEETAAHRHCQELKGKPVKITLLAYEDLTYRGMPGTYLFRIGDRSFAEPIPRSFSHKYEQPLPSFETTFPCTLKIFNKEYSVSELWKCNEICQVNVEEIVKILGGRIFFRIQQVKQNQLKPAEPSPRPNPIKPSNNEPVRPAPKPIEALPDRPLPRAFPELTPIKLRDHWDQDTLRKTLNDQDPSRNDQLDRFKRILNEPVDLSKYNFNDSDDDE